MTAPLGSLALHHTCSSTQLGTNAAATVVAAAIAGEVTVPVSWGCCAFAGDRGLLHPELTASATAREAAEVTSREHDAYASVNRTCEIGMSRATGQQLRAPARAAGAGHPLTDRPLEVPTGRADGTMS